MTILIIALIALGIVAAIFGIISHRKGNEVGTVIYSSETCSTCNGDNQQCEQECMMEAATKDIEYFDDEELDRYKDRMSDQYTDVEADEFYEVMTTMKASEVKAWNRSLILRHINMPDQIKDDYIALTE